MGFVPAFANGRQMHRLYPLLQVLNVIGTVWGFVWYGASLAHAPLWLLPFVPDCPLAALLMTIALWRWRKGDGETLQGAAVGVALFYAAWTVGLLLATGPVPEEGLLLAAHIGLATEALWLWLVAAPRRGWRLGAIWIALNTYADYALGVHPPLPARAPLGVVALLTLVAALAFTLAVPALEPAP